MELPLGNVAVVAAQLLLGAQLHAVVGELALAALAVLAGAVFALVHRALGAAPDVLPHAAVELVFRFTALGHRVLLGRCDARALLCACILLRAPTGGAPPRVSKRFAGLKRRSKHRENRGLLGGVRALVKP